MRLYISLVILASMMLSCGSNRKGQDEELESLYDLLDEEIARSKDYERLKDNRIIQLRKEYDLSMDMNKRTEIVNRLVQEFDAYNADSALYYVSYNLRRPAVKAIPGEYTRLMIKRADVLAHAGLFSDALATLGQIPRDSLTPGLLENYYSTYCATYQYLSEYTNEHETAETHERQRAIYTDSLNSIVKPGTFNYMVYSMSECARNGDPQRAIKVLSQHLKDYRAGTREYSILASTLSYIYKIAGDDKEYKRHLILSAISDVKGAVKENMSFREAATMMFEEGDIERANRYLKKSIADANFFSALLRNAQSSKMLPVIDEAYTATQNRLHHRLRAFVTVSCVLSLVLIVILYYTLRQAKRLRKANQRVNSSNEELTRMSLQVSEANRELEARNTELRDYNRTKEQYAALFMEYCSSAISTLQSYQQSLRVLTAQGGNRAALMRKLESSEISDQMLKTFYVKFDEAILNIYPDFVDKFNALLLPDERVTLKNGELLNTELRLFALIRLGIDDITKISQFLRCSVSTVYTYRSKMRKRAIDPANFEADVKNIG